MNQFAKVILIVGLSLSFMNLAGCGTVAGVGKDIKSAGKTIEDTAEKR